MTAQNGRGQGEETLYEGVVLPANGEPWSPEQQRQASQQQVQPPAGAPWGQPWGPDSQTAIGASGRPSLEPGSSNGQGQHQSQGQQGHQPGQGYAPHSAPGSAPSYPEPLPPAGAQPSGPQPGASEYGAQGAQQPPAAPPMPPAAPPIPGSPPGQQAYGGGAQGLPDAYGGEQSPYGRQDPYGGQGGQNPYGGQGGQDPYGQAHGGQSPQAGFGAAQPQAAYGGQSLPPLGAQGAAGGQPLGSEDGTQMLPPQNAATPPPGYGGQDSEATQFIPPYAGGPPGGGDADATQMLPPQTGRPQGSDAAARTPLPPESGGQAQGQGQGQGHAQGQAQGGPGQAGSGAQPPAGFENLFRAEPSAPSAPEGSGEPGSTQSLPVFDQASAHQYSGAGQPGPYAPEFAGYDQEPQGRAARRNAERGGRGRSTAGGGLNLSPGVLVAITIVVVAGVGVAAGAALSSGGGDDSGGKSGSSGGGKQASTADKAKPQAQELDKLLDDSNNSRTAVISAVENIKRCQKLPKAASDLRGAAQQRNGLVTRLEGIKTDALPDSSDLTAALKHAWKSSAAADNHYAAWARQTAHKKGCNKGKARLTGQVSAGNMSSGEATNAKKKAAGLWNPTAKKYGLKAREFGNL